MTFISETNSKKKKFGQFLIEKGFIKKHELENALKLQRFVSGERIGSLLTKLGYIDESDLKRALSEFFGHSKPQTSQLVFDEDFFLRETVRNENVLRFIDQTTNKAYLLTNSLDSTVALLGRRYESEIVSLSTEELFQIFREKSRSFFEKEFFQALSNFSRAAINVDAFLTSLLSYSVVIDASDIHFDVEDSDYCRIRIRSQGILRPLAIISKQNYRVLLNYIREKSEVPANVDVRKPIDASFQFRRGLIDVDLRVSIIPSAKAEAGVGSMVLRLFIRAKKSFSLEQLGFSEAQIELIRSFFHSQSGLIIVSGPTGSGKSTTVRAALSEIIKPENSVMSVEDPVEQTINLMKQVQASKDLTFETVLEAMLRHDPDVIFVGEIRSSHVAKMCLHAALTGHLVIATLHATTSLAVIPRLIELGADKQILLNSLKGIISQRLIRKICQNCKELQEVDPIYRKRALELSIEKEMKSRGCQFCDFEGYRGRTVIAEVVSTREFDPNLLIDVSKQKELAEQFRSKGYESILDHGIEKVRREETTIEEVLRVL